MGTKITRNLPNNAYQAATNANDPSTINPFATIDDLSTGSSGNQLISGGASYSGTGLVFDVSVLTYRIAGILYTTTQTSVTLNVGDPTNPRFDAIVADEDEVVSVVQGSPAVTPITPAIGDDQVLVQYVLVGANATTPTITTEYIYREDQSSDWAGSVNGLLSCSPNFLNSANFVSPTPTPVSGTACCLSVGARYGITQARGTRFAAPVPVNRADYAVLSFYINLPSPGFTQQGKVYLRAMLFGTSTFTDYLGYIDVGNYCDLSLTDTWQLVNIPTAQFFQNTGVTTIGGLAFTTYPNICNPPEVEFALDEIKLQTGFGPSTNIATVDILENDTVIADTSKINFIDGNNTTVDVTEDTLNNKVDVTYNVASSYFGTVNSRSIVEVTQQSDFGAGGSLSADTTYVVRGEVVIVSTLDIVSTDGVEIMGLGRDTDGLRMASPGTTMFNIVDSNVIFKDLKLRGTAPNCSIIRGTNISAGAYNVGRLKTLAINDCQFRNCQNVMDIQGFDLVDINNTLFFYIEAPTFGLRFEDTSKIQITSCEIIRWFDESTIPTPSGWATASMIELLPNNLSSFGAVNINGCVIHPQQTQNGIEISAGSTTGFGTISSNAFVNVGLTTGKVFLPEASGLPDYSATESLGYDVFANQGILNSLSGCVMTVVGNTNDTDLTQNISIPIETDGLAVAQAAVRFTVSAAGRATYTGSKQIYVSLHGTLAYEKLGGGSDDYTFHFFKNGVVLPGSTTTIRGGGDAKELSTSLTYGTLMSQNDYIEIYVENTSSDDDLLVRDLQVVIRE